MVALDQRWTEMHTGAPQVTPPGLCNTWAPWVLPWSLLFLREFMIRGDTSPFLALVLFPYSGFHGGRDLSALFPTMFLAAPVLGILCAPQRGGHRRPHRTELLSVPCVCCPWVSQGRGWAPSLAWSGPLAPLWLHFHTVYAQLPWPGTLRVQDVLSCLGDQFCLLFSSEVTY